MDKIYLTALNKERKAIGEVGIKSIYKDRPDVYAKAFSLLLAEVAANNISCDDIHAIRQGDMPFVNQ